MKTILKAQGPHGFFLFAFGLFACLHWLVYVLWWPTPAYATTHLIGMAGLALVYYPLSRPAFLVLILAFAIDGMLQAPVFSNHTMLKNFVVLAALLSAASALVLQQSWATFLENFATAGRWLLVGMYFFGIFHKINADFVNPEVSCATALWLQMPFPAVFTESQFLHLTGIWATFLVEAMIVFLLLRRSTRHLGIFVGIGFHAMLGLSAFEFYPAFSALTIALHCLFLPAQAHERLSCSTSVTYWLERLRSFPGMLLGALVAACLIFYTHLRMIEAVALGWLLITIPFAYLALRFGREQPLEGTVPLRSSTGTNKLATGWITALLLLFLFNGFTPYLGLKTAQSFNMFANLSLEGGQSNHLVFRNPPGPFRYLEDTVEITASHGVPYLTYIQYENLSITYYDLLNQMERAGDDAAVSFIRNANTFNDRRKPDLQDDFDTLLHPRWFRSWFHFTPVDLDRPKPCASDR